MAESLSSASTLATAPVLPTGTVAFLFTDIEGSTRAWEALPAAMRDGLLSHDRVLRGAVEARGGHVFKTMGDAFCVAFSTAAEAVEAAADAQFALQAIDWGEIGTLGVRMAVHVGTADERDGDYYGLSLNRAARLLAVGHGGQVLLSGVAAELARDMLTRGAALRDLGEHRLRDLQRPEHVFQLELPGLRLDFPPLRTLDGCPNNLPVQMTPFVGREEELRRARELLLREDTRLVTLTGPGGTGKTRLALHLAADLTDLFVDGAFFVGLETVRELNAVLPAIADALHVQERPGRPLVRAIAERLSGRQLLVLDNLEQVVEAGAQIAELLRAAPGLKALATSREVLRVYGEHEFPVPPLATADPRALPPLERLRQYEAVRLFVERATAVRPDFEITNATAPAVAEICHRLDGLPLAIELAAARVRLFGPEALLARLEERLAFLVTGARDLPARQRTLRGAIAWSYDLLDDDERALFARLGAFHGWFDLEAVEAVAGVELPVLDALDSLAAKSLLRHDVSADGEPRFAMLQTIRDFAREQLGARGEDEDVARRHASYFLELGERAEPELRGAQQRTWGERLNAAHPDLVGVLRWLHERGETEASWRLAGALYLFWLTRGHWSEGRLLLDLVLRDGEIGPDDATSAARAKALHGAGTLTQQCDPDAARLWFLESLSIRRELSDPRGIASTSNNLGNVARFQGEYQAAERHYREALGIVRELRDDWGSAIVLNNLGIVHRQRGALTEALELSGESLEIARRTGDQRNQALAFANLGDAHRDAGDLPAARQQLDEALTLFRALSDREGAPDVTNELGTVARDSGRLDDARALYEEALAGWRALGNQRGIGAVLVNRAVLALETGDIEAAAAALREALPLLQELGERRPIAAAIEATAMLAVARGENDTARQLHAGAGALRERIGAPLPVPDARRLERWLAAVGLGAPTTEGPVDATALALALLGVDTP